MKIFSKKNPAKALNYKISVIFVHRNLFYNIKNLYSYGKTNKGKFSK